MLNCESTRSVNIMSAETKRTMPFGRRRRAHLSSTTNEVEADGVAWICFAKDGTCFQGSISTTDDSNYSLFGRRASISGLEDEVDKEVLEKLGLHDQSGELGKLRKSSCGESVSESSEDDNSYSESLEPSSPTVSEVSSVEAGPYSTDEEDPKSPMGQQEYLYPYSVTLIDHFSGLRFELPKFFIKWSGGNVRLGQNIFYSSDAQVNFRVNNVFKGQKADMMIQRHVGAPSLLGQKCLVYSGPMSIAFSHVNESAKSWYL